MSSARSLLAVVATIAGLAEIGMAIQFAVDGTSDSAPAPAALFAVAFLALAWFVRAGKSWPVIALIVLFALEIAFVPSYARGSWIDWAEQAGFVAISIVGLIAGLATVAASKARSREAETPSPKM